jgi:hypothetical protein
MQCKPTLVRKSAQKPLQICEERPYVLETAGPLRRLIMPSYELDELSLLLGQPQRLFWKLCDRKVRHPSDNSSAGYLLNEHPSLAF